MKTEIIKKYSGLKLGSTSYGKNITFDVNDFSDLDKLYYIVAETYTSESSINLEGINFLKEYYGFNALSKLLADKGGLDDGARTREEIYRWLEELGEGTN